VSENGQNGVHANSPLDRGDKQVTREFRPRGLTNRKGQSNRRGAPILFFYSSISAASVWATPLMMLCHACTWLSFLPFFKEWRANL
jgi:hypothetical protein